MEHSAPPTQLSKNALISSNIPYGDEEKKPTEGFGPGKALNPAKFSVS